jgi:hypothetical protein
VSLSIDAKRLLGVAAVAVAVIIGLFLLQDSGGDGQTAADVRGAEMLKSDGAAAREGATALNFEAPKSSGERVRLSDYRGQRSHQRSKSAEECH